MPIFLYKNDGRSYLHLLRFEFNANFEFKGACISTVTIIMQKNQTFFKNHINIVFYKGRYLSPDQYVIITFLGIMNLVYS